MYSQAGVSDIIGVYKGRALFIEVKRPETAGTATKLQLKFLDDVKKAGAIAFIATSVEEVEKGLMKHEN